MGALLEAARLRLRNHQLFISHAWDYRAEYDGLVNLLQADLAFKWTNLSVPQDNPLQNPFHLPKSYRHIVRQLDERISKADCLIVFEAMYVAHRAWIQSEIEAAQDFRKPILAIAPRGQERFPEAVVQAATEQVRWNGASIIAAIRRLVTPLAQPRLSYSAYRGLGTTLTDFVPPAVEGSTGLSSLIGGLGISDPPAPKGDSLMGLAEALAPLNWRHDRRRG
jgi:MTH538 TIR-like domain (DUF1863)